MEQEYKTGHQRESWEVVLVEWSRKGNQERNLKAAEREKEGLNVPVG